MLLHRRFFALAMASALVAAATETWAASPAGVACPSLEAGLDAFARRALDGGVPGVVVGVARPGTAPLVRAFGVADLEHGATMTPSSAFRIASLTKSFTAAAVLRLVADGRLALRARAADLLPDRPWLGDITVDQLLNHTAGLADYAEDPTGGATKAVSRTPAEMADWIERLEPRSRFEPGSAWAYSNSHYVLLGLIIEGVTGRPYAEFVRDAVLVPASLRDTVVDDPAEIVPGRVRGYSLITNRPLALRNADWIHPSMPGPAGSFRATAADVLAWNQALFSGRVVPMAEVGQMIAPGLLSDGRTTKWGMPQAWREGLNADYGMGVFVTPSPIGRRVWHSGDIDGFASWMGHWPDVGVTAVVLTNADFRSIDVDTFEALIARDIACRPTD
jgi:CubicO group peptidase (beta-lactamase class C family)